MNFKFRWILVFMLFISSVWASDNELVCDSVTNSCVMTGTESFCGSEESQKLVWDIKSDTYALSCECNCTSQGNSFWLVAGDGVIKALEASKVINGLDVARNQSGVPDVFGIVPYCQAIKNVSGQLMYLQKRPTISEGAQPYCYALLDPEDAQVCVSEKCGFKKRIVIETANKLKDEMLVEFAKVTARVYGDEQYFANFPKRKFVERYIASYGYSGAKQQIFNDIAFYWQQAGFNGDSIWLLTRIIAENPKRVVVYLNIADAYWSEGDKKAAAKNYKLYDELMNAQGKQQRVPVRVKQRVVFGE